MTSLFPWSPPELEELQILFLSYSQKDYQNCICGCKGFPMSILTIEFQEQEIDLNAYLKCPARLERKFSDSWSEGKFAQATAGGIILGWVYLRYGFVVSLLIHWATNYFIFAYAHFISQINYVPLELAFSNPLMFTLELLFLFAGILAICILFLNKFYLKNN